MTGPIARDYFLAPATVLRAIGVAMLATLFGNLVIGMGNPESSRG